MGKGEGKIEKKGVEFGGQRRRVAEKLLKSGKRKGGKSKKRKDYEKGRRRG